MPYIAWNNLRHTARSKAFALRCYAKPMRCEAKRRPCLALFCLRFAYHNNAIAAFSFALPALCLAMSCHCCASQVYAIAGLCLCIAMLSHGSPCPCPALLCSTLPMPRKAIHCRSRTERDCSMPSPGGAKQFRSCTSPLPRYAIQSLRNRHAAFVQIMFGGGSLRKNGWM